MRQVEEAGPNGFRMDVKAILIAGGHGSRLYPFTHYTQKTMLPIYNRPVIDYALGTIRRAGIRDITIVSNQFIGQITKHVGQGLEGERIHYVIEEEPRGVSHALSLARPYNENARLLVYFSDNITTIELAEQVAGFREAKEAPGCILLAREEEKPHEFGVCEFDEQGTLIKIHEKPKQPQSNLAIGGIYIYDERFWNFLDEAAQRSGEFFSITEINNIYVQHGHAHLLNVGHDSWIDCGNPDSLLQASLLAKEGRINPTPYR